MKEESEPDRCEHGPWYEEYKDRTRFLRASTELAEQETEEVDEDE